MSIDVRSFPAVRDLDGLAFDGLARVRVLTVDAIQETPENVPEPISLQQAKDHLRVVISDEDDYIAGLIVAARQMAEGRLNRSLVRKTIRVSYDSSDAGYALRKPPFIQLLSVGTVDDDGGETTLDVSTYRTSGFGDSVSLLAMRGATWPNDIVRGGTLRVTYEAGYADGTVPKPIIQWMLLCIGTMYENRETMSAGVQIYAMPEDFAKWLLQPYMVYE